MFYDKVFEQIVSKCVFSEPVTLEIGNGSEIYPLNGIFYSGTYDEVSETKYARAKTMIKNTFQISESSLPFGVTKERLKRQKLIHNGKSFIISTITGADSGILNLELVEDGCEA